MRILKMQVFKPRSVRTRATDVLVAELAVMASLAMVGADEKPATMEPQELLWVAIVAAGSSQGGPEGAVLAGLTALAYERYTPGSLSVLDTLILGSSVWFLSRAVNFILRKAIG